MPTFPDNSTNSTQQCKVQHAGFTGPLEVILYVHRVLFPGMRNGPYVKVVGRN